MQRVTRPVALAAVLAAGAWTCGSPVRADEAETERRLKQIGVSKALRDDVRVAIDRGVAYLVSKQRADGVWVDPDAVVQVKIEHGNGLNALCALALLHADTQAARAAAKPAVARFFPKDGSIAPQLSTTVYGAGVALLLLDATGGDKERASWIAARIAEGRDPKSGTWNYRTGPTPTVGLHAPVNAPAMSGPLNLSTSQFAVLGLHAAARRGTKVSAEVWGDVLDGILAGHQPDGSWTYVPHHPEHRLTYSTGTLMGIANLVLAARHLHVDDDVSRGTSRKRRVTSAIAAARTALDADGVFTLWCARRGFSGDGFGAWMGTGIAPVAGGAVDGYALWSLEKACVFLGTERIDGVPWYADAARTLTLAQSKDGSWRSGQVPTPADSLSTTAFALLVLVRDIEKIRELTPGGTPQEPAVTPSAGDPVVKAPAGPESSAVPIDVAAAALTKFRALLLAPKTTNAELSEFFDLFVRARDDLAPPLDPKAPAVDPIALLRAIDAAMVDVLFVTGADPGGDEEGRAPVNRRAAEFLANAGDAAVSDVRRRAAAFCAEKKSADDSLAWTPYRPAFGLLASRGGADALEWMLDDALHDDPAGERGERSIAFLLAVPRFRGLSGAARIEAAKTIANRFAGRESAAFAMISLTPDADLRARIRWSRFRPRVIDALLALATDSSTGAEPRDKDGRALLDVKTFSDWLRGHDDARRAPWK